MISGNIPVLSVSAENLALAWERSCLSLWEHGCIVKTQYDPPNAPPSIDATMVIKVDDPMAEPRIHKCFPGGIEDLHEYVMELVLGVKDHWVRDPNDPNDTRWDYTYHQRFTKYRTVTKPSASFAGEDLYQLAEIDQLEKMCQQLAKTPYTRRANAVTWMPHLDSEISDPPCLQSIWCRMLYDHEAYRWRLNMNVRFRSRDAFKAAFMNMYALANLQSVMATRIHEIMATRNPGSIPVLPGRYCEISDSYHIYGVDAEAFKAQFLLPIKSGKRSFEERTFNSTDPTVREIMAEANGAVLEKIRKYDQEHAHGNARA